MPHSHPLKVEVCKSAVSNSSLHAFFAKLYFEFTIAQNDPGHCRKVKDKWLSIHEKYSAVRWVGFGRIQSDK